MKFYTCREQKDVNNLKSIILGPDRLGKKHFYLFLQERIVFFWLSDVPIYQYLCRQVQIARKESYSEGMRCTDLLLVKVSKLSVFHLSV